MISRMKLNEFIDNEMLLLRKFKEGYMEENKENPEEYLSCLRDRGIWNEIFSFYCYRIEKKQEKTNELPSMAK